MAVQTVESVVNELLSAIEEGYTHTALTRAISQLAVIVEDQDFRISDLEQGTAEQVEEIEGLARNQRKVARKLKKFKKTTGEDMDIIEEGLIHVGEIGDQILEIRKQGDVKFEAILGQHNAILDQHKTSINAIATAYNSMSVVLSELIDKYNDFVTKHNDLMTTMHMVMEDLKEAEEPITEE